MTIRMDRDRWPGLKVVQRVSNHQESSFSKKEGILPPLYSTSEAGERFLGTRKLGQLMSRRLGPGLHPRGQIWQEMDSSDPGTVLIWLGLHGFYPCPVLP